MIEIYIINLNKREDRWNKITQKINKFNKFNMIRIEAIEDNINGAIGCFKSHQKCVQKAKDEKLNKILVIEDDCDILNMQIDDFYNILKQLDIFLDECKNWNMFYGAGNKIRIENIIQHTKSFNFVVNSQEKKFDIYETNFLKTAHFVWYNNLIYNWILSLNPNENYPIDKVWHGKFNCLIIVPFITTQYDDYSNIENKKCSYTKSLKKYEKKLLKKL